jgi:Ca-activated chloride channel family protein
VGVQPNPVARHLVLAGLAASALAVPAMASGQTTFKSGIELVNLGVAVVDRQGGAIENLSPKDFEVFEAGRRQEIRLFVGGEDTLGEAPPLHIGLLFDTSGSMNEDMDMARTAAIRFLNRLQRAEDITIVDFDTEVRVATYAQSDFTRLVGRLRGRKPDGWTALFDALGVYLGGSFDQTGQKVLVIFTDGGDTRSKLSYMDVLTTLKASDVTVYVIGFLQHQSQFAKTGQRLQLQQIADTTGGQAYFPNSLKEVDNAYDRIVGEVESRYLLGYISSNPRPDGTWRPIEVKLTRGDLRGAKIRTRKGYYAPFKPTDK